MESSAAAARALTARTVHVKLYPTPRSFPERREVLRVLERFGEVSMFKSLKYNRKHQNPVHNAFLALFASEASAKELINSSPLRYRLVAETAAISVDTEIEATIERHEPQSISFSLNASTTTYDHHKALSGSQNPLHGPFRPILPRYSYIGSSLERTIPETLWSKGLMDWETDKGEDVVDGRIDGARISTSGESGRNSAGLERWDMMKKGEKKIQSVMHGLRGVVEQRQRDMRTASGEAQSHEEDNSKNVGPVR